MEKMENEGGAYFSEPVNITAVEESELERYQSELVDSLASCQEAMPPEAYEANIEPPAEELHSCLNRLNEAEKQYGAQPEVAAQYAPKHEEIKEKVQEAITAYKSDKPEPEKTASAKAVGASMEVAADFLFEQYRKRLEHEAQMRREQQKIIKKMEELKELLKNYSPDNTSKLIDLCMQFHEEIENIRKEAKEKKTPATVEMYRATKEVVHEVYTDIKAMPMRIKDAIKNKAYEMVDAGIRKIAGIFDKGISIIEKRKEAVLSLSPLAKDEPEKQVVQQETKTKELENRVSSDKQEEQPVKSVKAPVQEQKEVTLTKSPNQPEKTNNADLMISMKELLHHQFTTFKPHYSNA